MFFSLNTCNHQLFFLWLCDLKRCKRAFKQSTRFLCHFFSGLVAVRKRSEDTFYAHSSSLFNFHVSFNIQFILSLFFLLNPDSTSCSTCLQLSLSLCQWLPFGRRLGGGGADDLWFHTGPMIPHRTYDSTQDLWFHTGFSLWSLNPQISRLLVQNHWKSAPF